MTTLRLAISTVLMLFAIAVSHAYVTGKSATGPESVVRTYFDDITNKRFDEMRELFFSPVSYVAAFGSGGGPSSLSTKPAEEFIKWLGTEKQWAHVVDEISTVPHGDNLAVVLVTGHTETWRTDFRTVFTLTKEGGQWTILSILAENNPKS